MASNGRIVSARIKSILEESARDLIQSIIKYLTKGAE
jgi:hypothetical protein